MMKLHGVDIYLWTPQIPQIPDDFGPFKLAFISSRGTRVNRQTPSDDFVDWPQCRYLSDAEVTDAQVDELVQTLTKSNFVWTKCQKLYRKDGIDQFSQPY